MALLKLEATRSTLAFFLDRGDSVGRAKKSLVGVACAFLGAWR
jgi:hypothetical protein